MSWQASDCFVFNIEYTDSRFNGRMLEALEELLYLYGTHGRGWYLLGYESGDDGPDDLFEYNPTSYRNEAPSCYCWLPNPFMYPSVTVMHIRNPHDLLDAAFECADDHVERIAYAGDGDEPLQHMVIRGVEYDMRG